MYFSYRSLNGWESIGTNTTSSYVTRFNILLTEWICFTTYEAHSEKHQTVFQAVQMLHEWEREDVVLQCLIAMCWNTWCRPISWIKSSLEYFRIYPIRLENFSFVCFQRVAIGTKTGVFCHDLNIFILYMNKLCNSVNIQRWNLKLMPFMTNFLKSRESVKKKGLTEFKHRWMKFNLWTINFHIGSMEKAKQPAEMRFTEVLNTVWW